MVRDGPEHLALKLASSTWLFEATGCSEVDWVLRDEVMTAACWFQEWD